MPIQDNKNDLLFLLGAGASKDAGLPLAVEITEQIMADFETNHAEFVPLLRFVHGGICFGRGCAGRKPDEPVNVEEFLMACQDLARRDTSSLYPFVASWHERLDDMARLPDQLAESVGAQGNAFDFVVRHCKARLREWLTVSDPTKAKYFRNLKDFVDSGFRLHLFTLNYDECVELCLRDALGQINKKWTTGFASSGWEPQLFDRVKRKHGEVFLYKLHGSLDWVEDEELGVCSVKWPMASRAEEIPDEYESLLIFAAAMKVIPRDPYLTLLVRFRNELQRCKCVVILGYSFGDDHVNTMLLDALQKRPELQCVVANRRDNCISQLPRAMSEQLAHERFHNIGKDDKNELIGVREALEQNVLLEKVQAVCSTLRGEAPF